MEERGEKDVSRWKQSNRTYGTKPKNREEKEREGRINRK